MSIEQSIAELYKSGKSTYEIAEKLGGNWYALKVRRLLIKMGVPLRSKSAACQQAVNSGRSVSPTKGKTIPENVKRKIGESVSKNWEEMDSSKRKERSDRSRQQWEAIPKEKKDEMQAKAVKGILHASNYGSKMERYIVGELAKDGYQINFHNRQIFPTGKLEVDIFIPSLKTCIEVDGLSHTQPIWGDEALTKTQLSDNEKNGLALSQGYNMIRMRVAVNTVTQVYKEKMYAKLKAVLDTLKDKHNLPIEERLIYID